MDLLPLSTKNENILFEKISTAVGGVVRGQFLVVLTITTAAFFGFLFFGLPNPLLWCAAMFVGAFVPTFGTGLVWVPAIAYLYFTGNTTGAIGFAGTRRAWVKLTDPIGRFINVRPDKVMLAFDCSRNDHNLCCQKFFDEVDPSFSRTFVVGGGPRRLVVCRKLCASRTFVLIFYAIYERNKPRCCRLWLDQYPFFLETVNCPDK